MSVCELRRLHTVGWMSAGTRLWKVLCSGYFQAGHNFFFYHQKLHMKAAALWDQMEMNISSSHLQRCADQRRADCEPPPLHRRRSRGEKCCWGRACWSSRYWREPARVLIYETGQEEKGEPNKQRFKSLLLCCSAVGNICSSSWRAFKIR